MIYIYIYTYTHIYIYIYIYNDMTAYTVYFWGLAQFLTSCGRCTEAKRCKACLAEFPYSSSHGRQHCSNSKRTSLEGVRHPPLLSIASHCFPHDEMMHSLFFFACDCGAGLAGKRGRTWDWSLTLDEKNSSVGESNSGDSLSCIGCIGGAATGWVMPRCDFPRRLCKWHRRPGHAKPGLHLQRPHPTKSWCSVNAPLHDKVVELHKVKQH